MHVLFLTISQLRFKLYLANSKTYRQHKQQLQLLNSKMQKYIDLVLHSIQPLYYTITTKCFLLNNTRLADMARHGPHLGLKTTHKNIYKPPRMKCFVDTQYSGTLLVFT